MKTLTKNLSVTCNNSIVSTIIENRGFSNVRLSADNVDKNVLSQWHALCNDLLSACYSVASARFNASANNEDISAIDCSPVYSALIPMWRFIGDINGHSLRSSQVVAETMISMSVCSKNRFSAEMSYVKSQKSNATKQLKMLESTNGASKESIQFIQSKIEKIDIEIEELKSVYGSVYKNYARTSNNAFYKFVEDYVADMAEKRLCQTEAEYQAEIEARKQARKDKKTQKTKAQKADNVVVDYSKLSYHELQSECKKRNMSTKGKKEELISRLSA